MSKGRLKVKKKKGSNHLVTFDPNLSTDRRTFVLRVESASMFYQDYLLCVMAWATEELDELNRQPDQSLN